MSDDAQVMSLREEIARKNIATIKGLMTLGQAPNPSLDIRCTLELLVDLIFETDEEREQFQIQVEKLMGEKLEAALEAASKPQLHLPTS